MFHLNGAHLVFHPLIQKLEPPCTVKQTALMVLNKNSILGIGRDWKDRWSSLSVTSLNVFLLCFVIRAKKLGERLSVYKLGSDSNFLERLRKNMFSEYLQAYIRCGNCKC